MSLESPATYGEWYWQKSVDAQDLLDLELETEIAPLLKTLFGDIPELEELPDGFRSLLSSLSEPAGNKLGGAGSQIVGAVVTEGLSRILDQPMKKMGFSMGRLFKASRIDAPTAALLWQRQKITDEMVTERHEGWGYSKEEWQHFFAAQLPYPAIPEIFTWARYHGTPTNPKSKVEEKVNIDLRDYSLWEWLSLQKFNTLQIQTLRKREHLRSDQAVIELVKLGWAGTDPDAVLDMSWTYPNAMLQTQGLLMQGQRDEDILRDISKCDIHPSMAKTYYEAILTKPSSADIVAYHLRLDPSLAGLDTELRKIGIHAAYWPIYKELAQQIPPLPDIITMAVREAFTPAIAARFGQYEDFPEEFATWAAKKGLTEDWSKRYWAAHWNLPSPSQGFEMLHRGVIDAADLNMLMRAQDIMPFWRDKLVKIAYRPLTRVDVRRMYRLGVLSEGEVVEAYLDAGYDDRNAGRMAEFTVKQTLATQAKFSSSDIVKAFTNRVITAGTARTLLVDIGVRSEDAQYVVSTAQYKRKWAFTEQQIRGIRNLYKKRDYDENQARGELAVLNLPGDQIDVLMKQWWYEIKEEPVKTWTTAQTLGFMKAEIIGRERAIRELKIIGYDDEHINAYMSEK